MARGLVQVSRAGRMLDTACLALTGQGTSLQVPGTAQAKAWKLESEDPAPGRGSTGTS